tara:strand:- start:1167 stop:1481 length:315 start_codon:yes stop_codon:yes gene_type:complete
MTNNYANRHGHTDIEPVEIVRVISAKTLEVREMRASENLVELTFNVGGFSAHSPDQHKQAYKIVSDLDAPTYRIRRNGQGRWLDKYGRRHVLADKPINFFDVNF